MSTTEAPRTPRFRLSTRVALLLGLSILAALPTARAGAEPPAATDDVDPTLFVEQPATDARADLLHRLLARRHADRRRHPGGRRRQQGTPRLGRRHRSRRLPAHHPEHLLWRRCLFARRQVACDGRFRRSHPASRRRQRPRHPSAQRIHLRGRYARLSRPTARPSRQPAMTGQSGSGTCPRARSRRRSNGTPARSSASAFSPDGTRLASCGRDGTARVWDVATGEELAILQGHAGVGLLGRVLSRRPDPRHRRLGQHRPALGRHDRRRGGPARRTPRPGPLRRLLPDGKTLAAASARWGDDNPPPSPGIVQLWDVAARKELATLEGHTDRVFSIAFSADGKTLASGSIDATIKLWDVASRPGTRHAPPQPQRLRSAAGGPGPGLLARWQGPRQRRRRPHHRACRCGHERPPF